MRGCGLSGLEMCRGLNGATRRDVREWRRRLLVLVDGGGPVSLCKSTEYLDSGYLGRGVFRRSVQVCPVLRRSVGRALVLVPSRQIGGNLRPLGVCLANT